MDVFAALVALFLGSGKGCRDYYTVELGKISAQSYRRTLDIPISDENFSGGKTSIQAPKNPHSAVSHDAATRSPKSGTIQVFVEESGDKVHSFLPALKHGTGFKSVTSQWMQNCPEEWYMLKSYGFAATCASHEDPWDVKRPPKSIVRTVLERVRDPDRKWARVMRKISTRKEKDGSLRVFISCKTIVQSAAEFENSVKADANSKKEQDYTPFAITTAFVAELLKLEDVYCSLRSEINWKVLFLLHYQHANLNVFSKFLEDFTNDYVELRSQDFDPRSSKLRGWVLEEMSRDSYQYRQLTNIGNEMTDTLESLLEVVKSLLDRHATSMNRFITLEPVLRGCCKDTRRCLGRLTNEMESSLKFLELARNVRQTDSVQVLTILAAIFLPLSLAAGVLSMQSRLKDLGVLLYDFFGVASVVATVAILVITALVFWGIVQDRASRFMTERLLKHVQILLTITTGFGVVVVGALILSSFLVGMFTDIVLGAKILGYGLAVTIGSPVACFIIYLFLWIGRSGHTSVVKTVKTWNPNGRKGRQKNPEGDPGQGTKQQNVEPGTEMRAQDEQTAG